jgi:hypothetical protein
MRYIPLIYQNTEALAPGWPCAQPPDIETRALTHGGGEEG